MRTMSEMTATVNDMEDSSSPGTAIRDQPLVGTNAVPNRGEVKLIDLAREYGSFKAVCNTNLVIAPGEFVTLLGASGSGKTTTLMMIAGFVSPSRGDILIDGVSVVHKPPDKRNLGVVFQNYALFPHMNVADNIAFPLRMRSIPRKERNQRIEEALGIVKLEGFEERPITQLSGGQQQRVALARALVFRPPVLLMDEPLGALDRKLREQMQSEIKRIQRELKLTVIYVTHDQEEALAMSDRIAIMDQGIVHQVGRSMEVYERPATEYVGGFLGESNFLNGIVTRIDGNVGHISLETGDNITAHIEGVAIGQAVLVMMRPESLHLAGDEHPQFVNAMTVTIEESEYLGQSIRYTAKCGGARICLRESRRDLMVRYEPGSVVNIRWSRTATVVFPR